MENFGFTHSSSKFIATVFILIAGVLFYYGANHFQETKEVGSPDIKVNSVKESDHLVTSYMQETSRKMEARKKLEDMSIGFRAPKVGQMVPIKPEQPKPLELEVPGGMQRRGYLPPDISSDDTSPRATIEHQLNDQQRVENYDREYRQRYIQAFIENARRNGWDIKVNKNGVVVQASPLPGFDQNSQAQPNNIFIPADSGE